MKKKKKEYKQIIIELERAVLKNNRSWNSLSKYYFVKIHYYLTVTKEFEKAYLASSKLIELFETNEKITNNNLSKYIQSINNHILSCELTNRKKQREEAIFKLKQIPTTYPLGKNEYIAARIFETVAANEMNHIKVNAAYDHANEILEYFEVNEKKYKARLKKNRLLLRSFTLSTIYLNMGKFHDCNRWLNKILKEDEKHFGTWLNSALRSLQLIAHYEMGNFELVNYLQRSAYRFHQKKDKLYQFQLLFFTFFNGKILNTKSKQETIKHFNWLKEKLVAIRNDPKQNTPFYFFDYIAWVESKIENKQLLDVLKQKAAKT